MPHRPAFVLAFVCTLGVAPPVHADAFDQLTLADLAKAADDPKAAKEVTEATPRQLSDHAGILPGASGTLLIVRTAENRWAKVLVQPGRQNLADGALPILLVERFVTFRDGTERAMQASGRNVHLYNGFLLNLDLGQIVPEKVGGDLTLREPSVTRVVGKARMYVVIAPPKPAAARAPRPVVGASFEVSYFNGTYKLHDDGRRSGILTLQVDGSGAVSGSYYSDKDGEKYEVAGKVGTPRHAIQFAIKFPRVEQSFAGHLFTGDARAIAGTTRLQDREAGFYALRSDD